ncbi:MAG TPA: amino acid permease, partial [Candidatus Dormibacteraeota bacterium]|nr:amino acid permease [Candidatus Dormibacteraeota bacterium]
AAQVAGPASLIAWIGLSLASYPLAYTFASLSARKPESGGVYGFAKESLGPRAANAIGWLFILWYISGAPAVTIIAASYLAYAVPIPKILIYTIAGTIMLAGFLVNYVGISVSIRVQLGVILAIVGLLITAVVASAPSINIANFAPFAPNGLLPIGVSAALIFWSYLGYENVSNVAEEFKNPEKDFHRSILYSVIIISILYTSVAIAAIGTQSYKAGGSIAPFAAMLSNALGRYGAIGTAILAIIIIFNTYNAYTVGMSRVLYATAKEGGLPRFLEKIHSKTQVPHRTIMLLLGFSLLTLALFYILGADLETELLIPSGAAILVYVVGSASGIKLLRVRGLRRAFPWVSLLISIIMIPFVGPLILISLAFAGVGYLYRRPLAGPIADSKTTTE